MKCYRTLLLYFQKLIGYYLDPVNVIHRQQPVQ